MEGDLCLKLTSVCINSEEISWNKYKYSILYIVRYIPVKLCVTPFLRKLKPVSEGCVMYELINALNQLTRGFVLPWIWLWGCLIPPDEWSTTYFCICLIHLSTGWITSLNIHPNWRISSIYFSLSQPWCSHSHIHLF